MTSATQNWLERLGYAAEPAVLHLRGEDIPETHPYALEIKTLLKPDGAVRAQAVFDVEGVPTVVFVGDDDIPLTPQALDEARQRIWNQNLATVVIEVSGDKAFAVPARKLRNAGERLSLGKARPDGPVSALDVGGLIFRGAPPLGSTSRHVSTASCLPMWQRSCRSSQKGVSTKDMWTAPTGAWPSC